MCSLSLSLQENVYFENISPDIVGEMMAEKNIREILNNAQGPVSCDHNIDNLLLPEQLAVTLITCCYHDNVLLP